MQLFFSNRYSVTTDPSFLYYQNTSVFDTQEGNTVTEPVVNYLEDELTQDNLPGKSLIIKVNINEDFGSDQDVSMILKGYKLEAVTELISKDSLLSIIPDNMVAAIEANLLSLPQTIKFT